MSPSPELAKIQFTLPPDLLTTKSPQSTSRRAVKGALGCSARRGLARLAACSRLCNAARAAQGHHGREPGWLVADRVVRSLAAWQDLLPFALRVQLRQSSSVAHWFNIFAAAIFMHGTCDWPWQVSLQQEACSTRHRFSAEHDGPHGASVVAEYSRGNVNTRSVLRMLGAETITLTSDFIVLLNRV